MTQRAARIDYWTRYVAEQEAAEVKVWRPEDFHPGDEVKAAFGGWHRVLRVNTRSLTIPHWDLEGETWRLTYDKVLDHRPRPRARTRPRQTAGRWPVISATVMTGTATAPRRSW
ncbi:hypothetical protein Ga0074812_14927 [Parafrankia irregularis]|uniref:Uncharacterized protein n=1 Tax=Parafrankia irregularis TaxID=795642 RepID=A0A0S4QZJ0_9ACTN|nr:MULTISPECIES: hypothetical protein [Frankiaceae]KPM50307.1 hypothetical protein ACG83_40935 [Frankia sp. R43]CUU60883.1 hypothetical protein Ga0074812_14927 [Parafrankia irregularis]